MRGVVFFGHEGSGVQRTSARQGVADLRHVERACRTRLHHEDQQVAVSFVSNERIARIEALALRLKSRGFERLLVGQEPGRVQFAIGGHERDKRPANRTVVQMGTRQSGCEADRG